MRPTKPRKRGEGAPRQHGSSSAYREEEGSEDEGAISLNAIKNKYKSGGSGGGAVPNKGKTVSRTYECGGNVFLYFQVELYIRLMKKVPTLRHVEDEKQIRPRH